MRRLTIREFRAALKDLDEEVEIVRYSHTVGYFIPKYQTDKELEKKKREIRRKS